MLGTGIGFDGFTELVIVMGCRAGTFQDVAVAAQGLPSADDDSVLPQTVLDPDIPPPAMSSVKFQSSPEPTGVTVPLLVAKFSLQAPAVPLVSTNPSDCGASG